MLPHPLSTKLSQLFLPTGCLKAQLRGTPIDKEQQISRPGYLPSDRQHTKSCRTEIVKKTAFSYDLFIIIIIFFLKTNFFPDGFSLKWFYEKIFLKYPKIALCPSCVLYLSLLAKRLKIVIVVENSQT